MSDKRCDNCGDAAKDWEVEAEDGHTYILCDKCALESVAKYGFSRNPNRIEVEQPS